MLPRFYFRSRSLPLSGSITATMYSCETASHFSFVNQKNPRRRLGIALVMTMTILLLLSIFMTEFFFETTLEIRAIENFKSSFVAQSVAKSMFKAMLVALSTNETVFFAELKALYQLTGDGSEMSFLNPPDSLIPLPEGVIPDFEGTILYTPYVRPIDHLFNLNRIQGAKGTRAADTPTDRKVFNEFVNLLGEIPIEIPQEEGSQEPVEYRYLGLDDAAPLYAAIFDWMDAKDEGALYSNEAGVEGAEDAAYEDFDVVEDLKVKNRRLDRLTEIRLIKGITESGLDYRDWKQNFTVFDVGMSEGLDGFTSRLNINLATRDEIVIFLRRFEHYSEYYSELGGPPDNIDIYQKFVDVAEEFADLVVQYDEEGNRIVHNSKTLKDVMAEFELGHKFNHLFILYSTWYEIRLVAESVGIQSEVRAIVHVPRDVEGDANGGVAIKDFVLR
ncbi:MAG: general secretion pathway protein GspK [SAR324 cluster bacterium]|nr:general secretion pathway protein GspK [SAR324 cluster bacterium]